MASNEKNVRKKDILIVEDERAIAIGYRELFTQAGYTVRVAATGGAALIAFERKCPDVVFLDIMLPDGDGYDICRKIRKIDQFVPIVFNTALDSPRDIERGFEIGGDDYVLKTDPDRVRLARVARAIDRYKTFLARRTGDLPAKKIKIGPAEIDTAELTIDGGRKKGEMLTRTEADIIALLDSDRMRVFSTEEIVVAIRGEGFACNENMIYVHLFHIRTKLGKVAGKKILNISRTGYRLLP